VSQPANLRRRRVLLAAVAAVWLPAVGAAQDRRQEMGAKLLEASMRGDANAVRELAVVGAPLEHRDGAGRTALIPAAHHGHPETVRLLLDAGLDVNHVNRLGWTALLEAVILGDGGPVYQEIVGLLLKGGADARVGDREGRTALDHARARGFAEIAEMIEAAGRD
jgi:ankyrin repeat protein